MNNYLKWLTWGVGLSAVILIFLIQLGTFDTPSNDAPLEFLPYNLEVPSQSFAMGRFDMAFSETGTLRVLLTADTPDDAQYGLILREGAVEMLNVGFSTTGFVEVQSRQNDALTIDMPLQPWPHIKANEPIEIWLNWDKREVSIFVNREALITLETDSLISETQLFYYGDSFSNQPLRVIVQSARQ